MSGETVFHGEDLAIVKKELEEPKYRTAFDRNFWIWEEYNPKYTYILSADVSRGDGNDYSAFHIFKIETMEIIAEYQGKATPDLFSNLLVNAGKEYGDCMIVVENNSIGYTVLDKLREIAYPNIYYSYKASHDYIDPLSAETMNNTVAGFTMSLKTRPLVIAKMEEFIRNKLITVYSKRLFNEMETFVWHNGKPQAMRKYNDDLIMSCAIGCWVKDVVYTVNKREIEYKKAFLTCMTKSDTIITTTIPGQIGHKLAKYEDAKKKYRDFIWLLKG